MNGCPPCNAIKEIWEKAEESCKDNDDVTFTTYTFEDSKVAFLRDGIKSVPVVSVVIDGIRTNLSSQMRELFLFNVSNSGMEEAINLLKEFS